MSNLKPGDRALVVGMIYAVHRNGELCTVLSPCRWVPGVDESGLDDGMPTHRIRYDSDGFRVEVMPRRLVKLPPDDEAKRLFRETEKPIRAPAPLKETADALRDSPMSFSSEKPE